MKKIVYLAGAALAMMSMAACSGNCNGNKCDSNCDTAKQLYTGVLPAADAVDVRYALTHDYDDDNNNKGDYDLVETYLNADSTATAGVTDGVTYKSEGDFSVVEKDGKRYLKLVKDVKDSNPNAADNLYFEVSSDSTLTMVNSSLEPAVDSSLNYTLKLAK